jgi:hypothetical protein
MSALNYNKFKNYLEKNNREFIIHNIIEYYKIIVKSKITTQKLIKYHQKGSKFLFVSFFLKNGISYIPPLNNIFSKIDTIQNINSYNSFYNRLIKIIREISGNTIFDISSTRKIINSNFSLILTKHDSKKILFNSDVFKIKDLDMYIKELNSTIYEESLKYENPENLYIEAFEKFINEHSNIFGGFTITKKIKVLDFKMSSLFYGCERIFVKRGKFEVYGIEIKLD